MHSPSRQFDYIITGAGCSGLSLAWHMLQQPKLSGKRILIIDPDPGIRDDRTWCFWSLDHLPAPIKISKSWNRLEVHAGTYSAVKPMEGMEYHCVKGGDYFGPMLEVLRAHPQVVFFKGDVNGVYGMDGGVTVEAGEESFHAEYAFLSHLKPDMGRSQIPLLQHFLGWEIKTEKPVFDPGKAVFMDFRSSTDGGAGFMYVLPYGPDTALFEQTYFSESIHPEGTYREKLSDYISDLDCSYNIIREEKGVIPMADRIFNPGPHPRVVLIGTASGIPKASTGYAFSRIHRQAFSIAESLAEKGRPVIKNPSKMRFRAYDLLLLDILKDQKKYIHPVFEHIFRLNDMPLVLRFLDEQTHWWEDLMVMSTVPWRPFFRAIGRHLMSGRL